MTLAMETVQETVADFKKMYLATTQRSILHFDLQEHVIQPRNVSVAGVQIPALVLKVLGCVAHVSIILHSV